MTSALARPSTGTRAIAYIRVSTEREEMISPELQLNAIETHCAKFGYDIIDVVEDLDLSGRFWKRRKVEQVIASMERREAEVMVVWKISRVSRNRKDWAIAVDRVESVGGRMESATEPMDTTTSSGRFARGMLAELAVFESERIGDSWKETQARRIRNGLPASGKPRFGYAYTREQGFIPDPETGAVLRSLYLDYLAGTGMWKLAQTSKAHGGPTVATGVRRMMDSGFGAGYLNHRGEHVRGAHEAVISEDQWKAYKVARKERAHRPRAERGGHTYSGIVRCECGRTMTGNNFTDRKGRATSRYNCSAPQAGGDHTNAIITASLDAAVLDFLRGVSEMVDSKAAVVESKPLRRIDARPQIIADQSKNAARIDSLTLKYLDGDVSKEVHDRLMLKLHTEKEELQDRLDSLEVKLQTPPPTALAADLVAHWDQMPPEVKRGILGELVDRIEVSREGGGRWNPKEIRVIPAWEAGNG